jgi:hypothetical protein
MGVCAGSWVLPALLWAINIAFGNFGGSFGSSELRLRRPHQRWSTFIRGRNAFSKPQRDHFR